MKRIARLLVAVGLTAGLIGAPGAGAEVRAAATTVSFVAHQDDDLLFMNPDILTDIRNGDNVWVVYLTAGELPCGEGYPVCGMEYAQKRIEGVRAAYAKAANKPNVPGSWVYEAMTFNGREVATNRLDGTNVRLVFTYMHAAGGSDQCGDLARMVRDAAYVARPIDGRASYTRASFVGMLRSIINTARPSLVRTQNSLGHRDGDRDHVDHIAGAILTADADADATSRTAVRRQEYLGYVIRGYGENVFGADRTAKTEVWDEYWPHDFALGPDHWRNEMGKQYRPDGRYFPTGHLWIPPGDFGC
ncbi:PIG-L family deacetylase [Saccharothrix australiensis]|uniref:PIG-L family deacetylase n=1 Tax=Saccharothrix australiensis TaxID=2072 RepID=UPI00147773BF|nr:PIG-L family deacetylase [Saccharothrix australiensis]